jgi:uncharacterized membrane protein YcaP (DUF421 family)
LFHSIMQSMFHMQLPILEKIIRPVIVYLCLILFLRLFGKRELAQLNPFDLVVLLSLANTVQNAMIGDDNSVSGGIVGAFSLLAVNWLLMRVLFRMPRLNDALEGDPTTLITDGVVDEAAMKRETLTQVELLSVLHKQGLDSVEEVRRCVLEPAGTFYVEAATPSSSDKQSAALMDAIQKLTLEVTTLREELRARG